MSRCNWTCATLELLPDLPLLLSTFSNNSRAAGEVLVEVTDDDGAGHPVPRPATSDDDEDGRGLRLVQQLAAGWGYFGGKDRLSTWFELVPPVTQPTTPARNGL